MVKVRVKQVQKFREAQNSPKDAIVHFENVSKKYGKSTVLNHINFSLHRGELVGLIGPSGSGKTTLFKLLLEFIQPDEGMILFKDSTFTHRSGFASQDYSFYPLLTVKENFEYFGTMAGLSRKMISSKLHELLSLVGLSRAVLTAAGRLSGGMKRRLDLALALLADPDFLIVDEPTTGLDVITKKQIWELIADINRKGTTILVSSHDLPEVQQYCSSILFIHNKEILSSSMLQEKINTLKTANLEQLFRSLVNA